MNKFEHVGGGGGFLYSEVPCLGVEEEGGTGGGPLWCIMGNGQMGPLPVDRFDCWI